MQDHLAYLEKEYKDETIENKYLKIKGNSDKNFVIKLPSENGEEFWIIHRYKINEIKDVNPNQR